MLRVLLVRTFALLLGTGLLIGGPQVNADEITWNRDLPAAAKMSVQQQKPLLVMVSAKWCGYCQQMMKTTFRDPKVTDHISECFVPVYLDADKNEEWVEELEVESLPTTVIISPKGKVVKRVEGFQSAGQMSGQIVQVCNHTKVVAPKKPVIATVKASPSFEGTCLVSLRDNGKLVKGQSRWMSTHQGQVLYFGSAQSKARFDESPEKYWPVADGYCPVSQHVDRAAQAGQPVLAMIYADRVWFFADRAHQKQFTDNPRPYLALLKTTR